MFGVEIEVEGAGLDIPENKVWRQEADGSLRAKPECCEYVFKEPLSYEDSITAVGWLNAQHKKNGAVLNWSFRCSTHVHLNVQEMELSALLRLVYLYYIFENLLVKWSGEEREGNRFCLRLKDSSEIPFVVEHIFRNSLRGVNENQVRYSALNLGSLIKYGSVEFRSLSGTTDRERLSKWLNGIISLRDYAVQAKSLNQLFEKAKGNLNSFGKEVFGEFFSELRYMNWEFDALGKLSRLHALGIWAQGLGLVPIQPAALNQPLNEGPLRDGQRFCSVAQAQLTLRLRDAVKSGGLGFSHSQAGLLLFHPLSQISSQAQRLGQGPGDGGPFQLNPAVDDPCTHLWAIA